MQNTFDRESRPLIIIRPISGAQYLRFYASRLLCFDVEVHPFVSRSVEVADYLASKPCKV